MEDELNFFENIGQLNLFRMQPKIPQCGIKSRSYMAQQT